MHEEGNLSHILPLVPQKPVSTMLATSFRKALRLLMSAVSGVSSSHFARKGAYSNFQVHAFHDVDAHLPYTRSVLHDRERQGG